MVQWTSCIIYAPRNVTTHTHTHNWPRAVSRKKQASDENVRRRSCAWHWRDSRIVSLPLTLHIRCHTHKFVLFTRDSDEPVNSIGAHRHTTTLVSVRFALFYINERVSCAACNLHHIHIHIHGIMAERIVAAIGIGFSRFVHFISVRCWLLCENVCVWLFSFLSCSRYLAAVAVCVYCIALHRLSRFALTIDGMKVYLVPTFVTQSSCSLTFVLRGQL